MNSLGSTWACSLLYLTQMCKRILVYRDLVRWLRCCLFFCTEKNYCLLLKWGCHYDLLDLRSFDRYVFIVVIFTPCIYFSSFQQFFGLFPARFSRPADCDHLRTCQWHPCWSIAAAANVTKKHQIFLNLSASFLILTLSLSDRDQLPEKTFGHWRSKKRDQTKVGVSISNHHTTSYAFQIVFFSSFLRKALLFLNYLTQRTKI